MRVHPVLILSAAAMALTACASDRGPQGGEIPGLRERMKRGDGPAFRPVADPGKVAATDIAFSRMARDEGQWTAFLEYAADGALLHGRNGAIEAKPWLEAQANPAEAVRWVPNTVWSSCDGTLAVSFGRFVEPAGIVGSYVTVWELQRDRTYRWTYDMGAPDDPQPVAQAEIEPDIDTIIVDALSSIRGLTADCPRTDQPLPQAPPAPESTGGKTSADGTLRYSWQHTGEGSRQFRAEWAREGAWQEALEFEVPPQ